MRELLPLLWVLVNAWYRPEIRGIERVPRSGPVLVVGNHTGGVNSPEVQISQLAFSVFLGVERPHYQLAHRMVLNSPVGGIVRRFGTVEADPGNAELALDEGAMVTVFPGGDYEVYRPSWESAKVDFGGRKGFLRLALRKDVPIVPMVTIGGQETALFLSRGEWLAKLPASRPHDAPADAADRRRTAVRPQHRRLPATRAAAGEGHDRAARADRPASALRRRTRTSTRSTTT